MIAVDDGASPQTSTTQVIISILDVNDNEPEFVIFPDPIVLTEDAAATTIAAINALAATPIAMFEATDADAGTNAQVVYSIGGDPDGRFFISSVVGELFLLGELDFEVQETFSLLIIATDKGMMYFTYCNLKNCVI